MNLQSFAKVTFVRIQCYSVFDMNTCLRRVEKVPVDNHSRLLQQAYSVSKCTFFFSVSSSICGVVCGYNNATMTQTIKLTIIRLSLKASDQLL